MKHILMVIGKSNWEEGSEGIFHFTRVWTNQIGILSRLVKYLQTDPIISVKLDSPSPKGISCPTFWNTDGPTAILFVCALWVGVVQNAKFLLYSTIIILFHSNPNVFTPIQLFFSAILFSAPFSFNTAKHTVWSN
jgi:hypothetical protein